MICLQEVHCTQKLLRELLRPIAWSHHIIGEKGEKTCGGTAVLVSKSWCPALPDSAYKTFIPGRIGRLLVSGPASDIVVWNVHNHCLASSALARCLRSMQDDRNWVGRAPLRRSALLLGDLNIEPKDVVRYTLAQPQGAGRRGHGTQAETKWMGEPQFWTEFRSQLHTHFNRREGHENTIDRIFCASPAAFLKHCSLRCDTGAAPAYMAEARISDHVPVVLHIHGSRRFRRDQRPIPRPIGKHPLFTELGNDEICRAKYVDSSTEDFQAMSVLMLRHIARRVAKHIAAHPRTKHEKCSVLASISRAAWRGNAAAARCLQHNCRWGRRFLDVVKGKVVLREPQTFAELMRKENASRMQDLLVAAQLDPIPARRAKRVHTVSLASHLWNRRASRMHLSGIILADGSVALGDEAKAASNLYWAAQHAPVPVQMEPGERCLDTHGITLIPAHLPPAQRQHFAAALFRAKDSAPGPDAIPYGAMKKIAAFLDLMEEWSDKLAGDELVPPSFHACCLVYLAKGDHQDDQVRVDRKPEMTRPIALKNTMCKAISSTYNFLVADHMAANAHQSQRGFIKGRQSALNVAEFECVCHRLAHSLQSPLEAAGLLMDVKAAFPSVSRKWLASVLNKCVASIGLRSILQAMYMNTAVVDHFGSFLFLMCTGIAQGDPFSGTAFALCLDPWLRLLASMTDFAGAGICRACADDICLVVDSLWRLLRIAGVFLDMEASTNLCLNFKKCVILPLCANFGHEVRATIEAWLRQNIPTWKNMKIEGSATLLGIVVGPQSGCKGWDKPLLKANLRAAEINRSEAPMSSKVRDYNMKIVSCFGYVGQLLPPPRSIIAKELSVLHKACKLPQSSFTFAAAFSGFSAVGLITIRSFVLTAIASAIRLSLITCPEVADMVEKLRDEADGMLLADVSTHVLGPKHFEAGLVPYLNEISTRTFSDARFSNAMRAGLERGATLFREGKRKIQGQVYKTLTEHLGEQDLPWLMQSRFSKHFCSEIQLPLEFLRAKTSKRSVCQFVRWAIVKTLLGSWTTSRRMHSLGYEHTPCLFGCPDGRDDWSHYTSCKVLWSITACVAGHRRSHTDPALNMAECLLTPEGCISVYLAFRMYQACRDRWRHTSQLFPVDELLETALACKSALGTVS